MELRLVKAASLLVFIVVLSSVLGCAELQTKATALWERIQGTSKEEKAESREVVVEQSGYTGQKDELTLYSPTVQPAVVRRGNELSYQLPYALWSPDKGKEFDVIDVITLSGSGLLMELSKKTSKKPQGRHTSTLKFIVPPDLPVGSYKLISVIKVEGLEKKQQGNFMVKR